MKLKIENIGNTQSICLCALATDIKFANEIGTQLSPSIWEDDWARVIASIIMDYTKAYASPALDVLPRLAKDRASSIMDEDTASAVIKFARSMQDFYDEHDAIFKQPKYLRDTVLAWVKERNLTVLDKAIKDSLSTGDTAKAEEALHGYAEVKQVEITATDLLRDADKIIAAYEEDKGELMTMPEALGEMIGPLTRGDLMLILGESGTGKSWVSLQIALSAVSDGLSVLYVNLENADRQMIRRIYSNMCGAPRDGKRCQIPYFKPSETSYSDDDGSEVTTKWSIEYKQKYIDAPKLDRESVSRFLQKERMVTNGGRFYLLSFPPKTLTVHQLEVEMDNLRDYKNFVPDVLVVDYGDLMKPTSGRDDKRTQIDEIYLGLRSIALARDILVISPIQSNRAGYGRDVGKANVAENIGNVNHSAVILGLNHTPAEKEKGITRIRILKNRDNSEPAEPAICIGCLDIGRPIMHSRRMSQVSNLLREDDDD